MIHLESVLKALNLTRTTLLEVEGVPLLRSTAENWATLQDFQARPDDLLICTYPKAAKPSLHRLHMQMLYADAIKHVCNYARAGTTSLTACAGLLVLHPGAGLAGTRTTWIQEIVEMIQHRGDPAKCSRAPIYKRIPYIDIFPPNPIPSGVAEADAMPSPRTLKSHIPVQLLPPSFWEQNCKVIYVARNVKDNAVSYFYFHRMNQMIPDSGSWDQFLQNFVAGKVLYGSWFDHVCSWWEAKDWYPILYLFYEDIKEDPAREIQKIAQFLGQDLSEPVLNKTVQHTSFESMKANPMVNYSTLPSFILNQSVSPFMRRGIVGDWKDHFTVAQSEQIDDIYAREMKGKSLTFRTQL